MEETKQNAAADEIDRRVQEQINGENTGRINYVIGGQGEAELNLKDSPEDTIANLQNVAEQCGYFVTKGSSWTDFMKVINVALPHGNFRVEYYHGRLTCVIQEFSRTIKTFPEDLNKSSIQAHLED